MAAQENPACWLELASVPQTSGVLRVWPVVNPCSIGRADSNRVVLVDRKVSRRHAIIHCQGGQEFWLVDLGSSNGTFLNNRRLAQPTRLRHGDRIAVGDFVVAFHQPASASETAESAASDITLTDMRRVECWLLIADIIGYSNLSQSQPVEELAVKTGRWLAACQQVIDGNKGTINKFLGDGFFAYWPDREGARESVVTALKELQALQEKSELKFRLVLHWGMLGIGGTPTLGEESLLGPEVNFVFRLEKVAASQQVSNLMSASAQQLLSPVMATREAGRHPLVGFPGEHAVFSF